MSCESKTYLTVNLHLQGCDQTGGWGGEKKLLGIGGAAEHLADGLGDGITIDAIDLEQLVWFATAGDMRHSQAMQTEARLIDHC